MALLKPKRAFTREFQLSLCFWIAGRFFGRAARNRSLTDKRGGGKRIKMSSRDQGNNELRPH